MTDHEHEDPDLEGGFGYPPEGEQDKSAESAETLSPDELGREDDEADEDEQ